MRPCFFYTFLSKVQKKIVSDKCCNYVRKIEGDPMYYYDCPYFKYCQKENIETKNKEYMKANTVMNINRDNNLEYIVYNKPFLVKLRDIKPVERKKMLKQFEDGYIFRSDVLNPWERLKLNRRLSGNRAKDLCYNYIYNNNWKYFVTLTFSPHLIDRNDNDVVKHEYKKFRENFQYYDPNIKILCVPEEHEKDKALHFHILIDTEKILPINMIVNKDIDTWNKQGEYACVPQCNDKTFLFPIVEFGRMKMGRFNNHMYALSSFNKGRNFTSIIDPEKKHMAYNYMAKYLNKLENIGYGQKRIYATGNLDKRTKLVVQHNEQKQDVDIILDYGLSIYKSTNKFTVYRNYNIMKEEGNEE